MLTLATSRAKFENFSDVATRLVKLSTDARLPNVLRPSRAFIIHDEGAVPSGFGVYVFFNEGRWASRSLPHEKPWVLLPDDFAYLRDGDIMRVSPVSNNVRVLFRRNSPQNFTLVTERCNNYCLMCSQPPKRSDDSWLVDEILELLPLIDRGTREITITGGEPTLLGDRFIAILESARSWLPQTAIHVLSNGRNFADFGFASKYAAVRHHDIMVGIPLYSDLGDRHDYVVQADGAFDETIRGILNLKRLRQRVEIRVVLHRQTVDRLPELATFIARNLRFVDQVALMGLEMTGFTKANLGILWIDPYDYRDALREATLILDAARIKAHIYNHQLCVLDPILRRFARKSISDWKNEYLPSCVSCDERADCGGFFSSAKLRFSDHISPIKRQPVISI